MIVGRMQAAPRIAPLAPAKLPPCLADLTKRLGRIVRVHLATLSGVFDCGATSNLERTRKIGCMAKSRKAARRY